jgi:hypothetical protein
VVCGRKAPRKLVVRGSFLGAFWGFSKAFSKLLKAHRKAFLYHKLSVIAFEKLPMKASLIVSFLKALGSFLKSSRERLLMQWGLGARRRAS